MLNTNLEYSKKKMFSSIYKNYSIYLLFSNRTSFTTDTDRNQMGKLLKNYGPNFINLHLTDLMVQSPGQYKKINYYL